MLTVILSLVLAQQSPEPPQRQVLDVKLQYEMNYKLWQQGMADALRQNKKHVTYINQRAKAEPGAIVLELEYQGLEPTIIRNRPENGYMTEDKPLAIPFAASSKRVPRDDSLQKKLVSFWPKDVDMPAGMVAYVPTRKSQRLTITNDVDTNLIYDKDQDDHFSNAPTVINPNRQTPWAVPGGLDGATGWESVIAVAMPGQPTVYNTRVEAGARHPLPKLRWTFPEGTVFADLLVKDGKPFELRTRRKVDGQWVSRVEYRDRDAAPVNYHGAGKACIECHQHAGSQLQYGIGLRGDDGCFSWAPWDHLHESRD